MTRVRRDTQRLPQRSDKSTVQTEIDRLEGSLGLKREDGRWKGGVRVEGHKEGRGRITGLWTIRSSQGPFFV